MAKHSIMLSDQLSAYFFKRSRHTRDGVNQAKGLEVIRLNGRRDVQESGSVPIYGRRGRRRSDGGSGGRGRSDSRGLGRRFRGSGCVHRRGLGLRALDGVREEFEDLADNLLYSKR